MQTRTTPTTGIGSLAPPHSRIAELRARARREGVASAFYFDFAFGADAVKVLPGEYYVSDEEIMIGTVLGSCVAACLMDRSARIGGMNHFMLPDGSGEGAGRYGLYAMELLVNELLKAGAVRSRLEAKIFGGGRVIRGMDSIAVGDRNVEFVERFLANERIPILSRDVLDVHPRKVQFFPTTGRALVKKLGATGESAVVSQEMDYARAVRREADRAGAVELF